MQATFWELLTTLTECARSVCDEHERGTLSPVLVAGLRESVNDIYAASWSGNDGTVYRVPESAGYELVAR